MAAMACAIFRERLHGHFGAAAGLHIDRDSTLGRTRVTLRLPCALPQPAEARVP